MSLNTQVQPAALLRGPEVGPTLLLGALAAWAVAGLLLGTSPWPAQPWAVLGSWRWGSRGHWPRAGLLDPVASLS